MLLLQGRLEAQSPGVRNMDIQGGSCHQDGPPSQGHSKVYRRNQRNLSSHLAPLVRDGLLPRVTPKRQSSKTSIDLQVA